MRPIDFMGRRVKVSSETGQVYEGIVNKVSGLQSGKIRLIIDTGHNIKTPGDLRRVPLRNNRFTELGISEAGFTVDESEVIFLD